MVILLKYSTQSLLWSFTIHRKFVGDYKLKCKKTDEGNFICLVVSHASQSPAEALGRALRTAPRTLSLFPRNTIAGSLSVSRCKYLQDLNTDFDNKDKEEEPLEPRCCTRERSQYYLHRIRDFQNFTETECNLWSIPPCAQFRVMEDGL